MRRVASLSTLFPLGPSVFGRKAVEKCAQPLAGFVQASSVVQFARALDDVHAEDAEEISILYRASRTIALLVPVVLNDVPAERIVNRHIELQEVGLKALQIDGTVK